VDYLGLGLPKKSGFGPTLLPYLPTCVEVDFSYLNQNGWRRLPPLRSNRGHLEAATHPHPKAATKLALWLQKG
jgi:hypothetical protein